MVLKDGLQDNLIIRTHYGCNSDKDVVAAYITSSPHGMMVSVEKVMKDPGPGPSAGGNRLGGRSSNKATKRSTEKLVLMQLTP